MHKKKVRSIFICSQAILISYYLFSIVSSSSIREGTLIGDWRVVEFEYNVLDRWKFLKGMMDIAGSEARNSTEPNRVSFTEDHEFILWREGSGLRRKDFDAIKIPYVLDGDILYVDLDDTDKLSQDITAMGIRWTADEQLMLVSTNMLSMVIEKADQSN
jgi:hypothetical protein